MKRDSTRTRDTGQARGLRIEDSVELSQAILRCANRGLPRSEFWREVSQVLMDFSGCDAIEVRLSHGDLHYRWEAQRSPEKAGHSELARWIILEDGKVIPASEGDSDLERLCTAVVQEQVEPESPFFTRNGSFWTGDTWESIKTGKDGGAQAAAEGMCIGGHYRSLALIRFFVDDQTTGLLLTKSEQPDHFSEEEVELYEGVAQTLGLAVADQRAQAALRERVKELTCLYGIAQVVEQDGISLGEILQRIVELLPPSWQYPQIAAASITLGEHSYTTQGFRQGRHRQLADIVVRGVKRGVVEVGYLEELPEFAVGAFLKEEEELINAVAREVELIVERKEAEEDKSKLQRQLIHADRLATIGELAAGVAHELNEPLGGILGFAQLAKKNVEFPAQLEQDLEKIINASLYAREVIKKLMVFSRQMPPKKAQVNLNQVVEDGLYFLQARCEKANIQIVRDLAPNLPEITADPAQLNQVLVNLVVNAVQSMPDGGPLTISTRADASSATLIVEDTGIGMNEEVLEKIFLPFYTTKDIDEGTGLGLAVVHGIVASHNGSIDVRSQPGQGSRFEVRLPITKPKETQGIV